MDIQTAKIEIANTIRAYLKKDEAGAYEIPVKYRRPLLLMGPPGIGKTAVMEQIAQEEGLNLLSYTITHHTRQSAIGLPVIRERTYAGRHYDVTEYTMSEIIAAVYEAVEASGNPEGILFLDEINCVSETLSPTLLQFLQYKTFGTHRLPEGFCIIAAGNPPQYNRTVREFDIVTLDRMKRLDVSADLKAWKDYAYRARIHGSIMAYLDIRPQHFYSVEEDADGARFVTARGWEDLSRLIYVYEKLGSPVTKECVLGFLQHEQIASDFTVYYELYQKYKETYRVADILSGTLTEGGANVKDAPFDEKLSLLNLLYDAVANDCAEYEKDLSAQLAMRDELIKKRDGGEDITSEKEEFDRREAARQERITAAQERLAHVFTFLERTFGQNQEMVIFLTFLSSGYYSIKFLHDAGSEPYDRFSHLLLLHDEREEIRREVLSLKG